MKGQNITLQPATCNLQLDSLIAAALAEDIGTGDITSQLLIPEQAQAEMQFVARGDVVACGTFIPAEVYAQLIPPPLRGEARRGAGDSVGANGNAPSLTLPLKGEGIKTEVCVPEGQFVKAGTVLAVATGPARALLAGERVVLNLMQRMSGVATLTKRYVDKVAGTKAIILDTRKTMPGLRALDKYAVKTGGGQNHRMGLWDAVLVKDNHIALRGQDSGSGIQEIVKDIRNKRPLNPESRSPIPIIIECDTLAQVQEALTAKPDRILLDNMDTNMLRKAVAMAGGKIPLEASGGVSLETVRAIAETGVDYISVGALTHSAVAVDIGADVIIESER